MRKPQGYVFYSGPEREDNKEGDSFTCGHCQRIIEVKPFCDPADAGGLCFHCARLVCPDCVKRGTCTPWEQTFERMIARADALRSYGF